VSPPREGAYLCTTFDYGLIGTPRSSTENVDERGRNAIDGAQCEVGLEPARICRGEGPTCPKDRADESMATHGVATPVQTQHACHLIVDDPSALLRDTFSAGVRSSRCE